MILIKKTFLLLFLNILMGQNWFQKQVVERPFDQAVEHYNEGRYATSETILKNILDGKMKPETLKKITTIINQGKKSQFLQLVDMMYK